MDTSRGLPDPIKDYLDFYFHGKHLLLAVTDLSLAWYIS